MRSVARVALVVVGTMIALALGADFWSLVVGGAIALIAEAIDPAWTGG